MAQRREGALLRHPERQLHERVGEHDVAIRPGVPKTLFTAKVRDSGPYAVSKDGQRFLLNPVPPDPIVAAPPITAVINWSAG